MISLPQPTLWIAGAALAAAIGGCAAHEDEIAGAGNTGPATVSKKAESSAGGCQVDANAICQQFGEEGQASKAAPKANQQAAGKREITTLTRKLGMPGDRWLNVSCDIDIADGSVASARVLPGQPLSEADTAYLHSRNLCVGEASRRQAQAAAAHAGEGSVAIRNVRIFDGLKTIPGQTVVIKSGVIQQAGKDVQPPAGGEVIDGSGATLLPGLINAHSNVADLAALQDAIKSGVTTELDMSMNHQAAQQIRKTEASGGYADAADLRSAGTPALASDGYGSEAGLPFPASADDAAKFVDARIAEGSDYIEVTYGESGKPRVNSSREMLPELIAAAHRRGELVVVHLWYLADAKDAIAAGADGLVHHMFPDRVDPELARLAASHRVFVVPTLVAPFAMATANPRAMQWNYRAAEETVRRLKAASVLILAGTDVPPGSSEHGAAMQIELQLLVQAGLTPTEALAAATSAPAQAFRLGDRGRIAAGKRADLVLVEGDPTRSIEAAAKVIAVWKAGKLVYRGASLNQVSGSALTGVSP